jgi:hypothetical protein
MWCFLLSATPHIESQPIHLTQQVSGSALRSPADAEQLREVFGSADGDFTLGMLNRLIDAAGVDSKGTR